MTEPQQPQSPPSASPQPAPGTDDAFTRGLERVTGSVLGPYQTAIVRIGFAATWLFFLLRELPHRGELYGPDSPWGWGLAEQLIASNDAFTVLMWTDSRAWFECVYLLAILSSAALLLGWRTRLTSVLFMIGVLSLQNRSVFMGDGGDNVVHLMAIYLVLTRCARVWSLDARRTARRGPAETDNAGVVVWSAAGFVLLAVTVADGLTLGWGIIYWGLWAVQGVWWAVGRFAPGEPRRMCDILANLVHNGTLVVIMAEVCLIYATAGWYKIQGSRWQDGTAAYYPMFLDYFAPWPELNSVLAGSGVMIMIMTYGTVMVQVAFPFTLFNRRVKNVLLAVMITEHLSIAVLLGLPFFSMAMIAADAVFLPTVLLVWLGARASGLRVRLSGRLRGSGGRGVVRDDRGGREEDDAGQRDGQPAEQSGGDTGTTTGTTTGSTASDEPTRPVHDASGVPLNK